MSKKLEQHLKEREELLIQKELINKEIKRLNNAIAQINHQKKKKKT